MAAGEPVLLGVDGGATGIRCHEVKRMTVDGVPGLVLGAISAEVEYTHTPGFSPIAIDVQRCQYECGDIQIDAIEDKQAHILIASAADVIVQVAKQLQATTVQIGIGMPGIKTIDARGIAVINNGPRIPKFLDRLTDRLESMGVNLGHPICRIGDDSVYCGLGETQAQNGMLREISNGYYIGGGTGLAECVVLGGQVQQLSALGMRRAWELSSPLGPTYEQLISAASMNAIYEKLAGTKIRAFVETEALSGNAVAIAWLHGVALMLAHLMFSRMADLSSCRSQKGERVRSQHFERIVVGQRLGSLYEAAELRPFLATPTEMILTQLIVEAMRDDNDKELGYYIDGEHLRSGLIVASKLRAAPAIGAAYDALRAEAG